MSFEHYELTEGGVYRARAASEIVYRDFAPPAEMRAEVVQEDERVLQFEFTNTDQDRHESTISTRGLLLKHYRANPAFCAAHAKHIPNIGRTIAIRKVLGDGRDFTEGRVRFAGDDQRHPLAEMYYLLFRDDFLRAVSVGIIPHEFRVLEPEEAQPKNAFMREFGAKVMDYTRSELVEVSGVNVGSNRGALKRDEAMSAIRDVGRQCSVDEGLLNRFLDELDRAANVTARPLGEALARQHAIDWDDDPADDRGWGDWSDRAPEVWTDRARVELAGEDVGEAAGPVVVNPSREALAERLAVADAALLEQVEATDRAISERDAAMQAHEETRAELTEARGRIEALELALAAAEERTEAEPDEAVEPGLGLLEELIRAEVGGLRRHFEESLVELFGQMQDDREQLARAVLAQVDRGPLTPAQTPVAPVEDPPSPARSTPQPIDIEQLGGALQRAVATAIQEHRGFTR